MTHACPQGHTSSTDDFCDVCGAPMGQGDVHPTTPPTAALPSLPPVAPPSASTPARLTSASPQPCPHCSATNPADVLFCEDCGYDFATGQLPPVSISDPASGSVVSSQRVPVEPANLSGVEWVAEIWVDPDWFTNQQAEGTCPTSGLPTVVPLRGTPLLIGRRSRGRNIEPEIDCASDAAISHRHAELTRNGERWSVKDLGSTNGTYVGSPRGIYPHDPLPPHRPRELADDERIYLGAWTRVVVRKAIDAEKVGAAP
jgi:FHA domain